jgi:site-specific recombinase
LEVFSPRNPTYQKGLEDKLQYVANHYNFFSFFAQYSLPDESGFASGVWGRLKHKVIPRIPEDSDIQYFVGAVMKSPYDLRWIRQLPRDAHQRLFGANGPQLQTDHLFSELDTAIRALGVKSGSFGMDHGTTHLYRQLGMDTSPFFDLQSALSNQLTPENLTAAATALEEIFFTITNLRLRKNEIGTSLRLTYQTSRSLSKLAILRDLIQLRQTPDHTEHWLKVVDNSLRSEASRFSVRQFVNRQLDLLSLEIVEHTARSGEKYIAENRSEYFGILRASMLGGLLIACFAAAKIYFDGLQLAELPEAVLFSMNYATCFVLVKTFGGIIAKKQPAMVASTIIKNIDQNNNLKLSSLQEIVNLIKKASRSQFISFVGNLSISFPLAMLINQAISAYTESPFISSYKGEYLLNSIWPFAGGAIAFAAIAGVFLALSGLISGYFDNKVVASRLHPRLVRHPFLRSFLSKKNREKLAKYLCKNIGALSGNVSLGFFLGMAGWIGFITWRSRIKVGLTTKASAICSTHE